MDSSEDIRKQIRTLEEIPTLPGYFATLMSSLDDDRVGAKDLARIIAKDASLTSKVLKLANSAYYGRFKRVATADQAVMTVGFREIKTIVMSIGLFGAFANRIANTTLMEFWVHALLSASAVQMIGDRKQEMSIEKLYFGGLLHDIGKLVFCILYGDKYLALVARTDDERRNLPDEEKAMFGMHHGTVGGWLAERWHFPAELQEVITHHHLPKKPGVIRPQAIATVYLADQLAHLDAERLELTEPNISFCCSKLGLRSSDLEQISTRLSQERERVSETFSMVS